MLYFLSTSNQLAFCDLFSVHLLFYMKKKRIKLMNATKCVYSDYPNQSRRVNKVAQVNIVVIAEIIS